MTFLAKELMHPDQVDPDDYERGVAALHRVAAWLGGLPGAAGEYYGMGRGAV